MTAPAATVYWLHVVLICSLVVGRHSFSIQEGGLLTQDLKLQKWASPITVKGDVFVHKDVTLSIAAGVVMRFAPGVMLAVNGTLKAEGLPDDRITMTRMDAPEFVTTAWPGDIRLVDDQSVMYGRLQILYRGRWRGICANSQNWTQTDTDVACRQLGFLEGNFSFVSWARNDSRFMLYHRPDCSGSESNILDCAGSQRIQIGSRICVQQKTIHLHCYGLAPQSTAASNWWGLEFYNATLRPVIKGSIAIYESNSVLENVDILYAGLDPLGNPVPAVRASPTVPRLDGVAIRYCALDATNFTDINASTIVHNSDFELNRGHGLVVESRFGRINVTDSRVVANSGNGIKAKLLDSKFLIIDEQKAFCRRVNTGGYQQFPQVISGIPFRQFRTSCDKMFRTEPGHIITFNVLEMDIEPDATGWLQVYDGKNERYTRLAKIPIINGTLPQGLSSTKDYMFVTFSWSLPKHCPTLRDCVKFTVMLDSGPDVVPEFYVNNTQVHNNTQHGIFLENVRNKAVVNASSLSYNGYGAGLRVYGGAGDIQVNASNVTYNEDNGVNITYDGGRRIFNMSSFSYNLGNGVNVTLNETSVDNKTRHSMQQRTEVWQSTFTMNDGIGFRIGNYCREGHVVVNDSQFISNQRGAIEMESCFRLVTRADRTNFTIGYNKFESNFGHAVKIAPMLNVVGRIANNTFTGHPRYVLLVDNTDDLTLARDYTKMLVQYDIMGNRFFANRGFYVANVRLTQGSKAQQLDFKFNRFENNVIDGGGTAMTLNQRTRAHAVVIVSSSNVHFERNALLDPESRYEVATHLLDQSATLTSSPQWWGTIDYNKIVPKIFDQSSRYNLARINYHPALKYDLVYDKFTTFDQAHIEIEFNRGSTIGGRLYNEVTTEPNKRYRVDRDIDVMPTGRLNIKPGTILEFENSIGMLIQGTLRSEGRENNQVVFRLRNETTSHNNSRVRLGLEEGAMEGRLEIRPTDTDVWGTVCSKGWTIVDASVVCQMLGLVVHPSDWRVYATAAGPSSQPIWRSRVDCTELDMDVTNCKADGREDHSCTHDQDVHVRCKKPTWAGIRFLAKASPSRLVHTTVSQAGLMDPTAIMYSSAIMIDYNVHTLEHLTVTRNMGTGIDILHNDIFRNAKIRDSVVSDNLGNGVVVRASFFTMAFCTLRNNAAGFEYNPSRTTYQGLQLRAGIHDPKVFDSSLTNIRLDNQVYVFVVTKETIEGSPQTYFLEVSARSSHRVVMDVLDYNPEPSQENVTVFDGRRSSIDPTTTRRWRIEDDMADFPVESSGTSITIQWRVSGSVSGRFAFVLHSKPWDWRWPFAKLTVMNTTTEANDNGIVTRHYNQPSNEFGDLFHRYRWETVRIYGVTFSRNRRMALHVPSITKYHELYLPTFEELQRPFTAAEITYELDSCLVQSNGGGVVGEHNHVEFSNNMWIWQVTNNVFRDNDGGFALELPLINLTYQELYNHSVDINDTLFERNRRFEFRIDGFYCNSTIARNRFVENHCLKGCITITGTEKDIDIHDNEIFDNTGKYIMELNMKSHTPYTRWVEAEVTNNDFKRNKKLGEQTAASAPSSSPISYTLGIKGLQNITINRNLFANSLDYELVGGYASSSLDNYLDVRENWWGSTQQTVIREKIFDFDDWNSYAIAEYYPFLISNHFGSTISSLGKEKPVLDLKDTSKPLGGRIETSLRLKKRPEPYVIRSDLTIMPNVRMVVEPGVELQFYPNVGILVLGSLSMRGYPENVIKAGPVKTNQRQRRDVPAVTTPKIQLVGGETEDEGFIQIYNSTERRWALICDTNFNDETAEVACRTMGHESSNVIVERSRWYDIFVLGYPKMHEQVIEWFWRETLICDGTEDSIDQCRYKVNYNLNRCMERRDYVFVRCGPRNLAAEFEYWGNIRFSTPEYEQDHIKPGDSTLDYVDIYGGGMLHGERVAAIQAVHRTPVCDHVRVTNCAWNGYDFIAPREDFLVTYGTIKNNNGYGVGGLVLNGESRYDIPRSSFLPLVESSIPYNVFGLVRMCTTEKLIYVQDRLLLYYKYAFESIDCIKIIRSVEPDKRVALRFLQLNLLSDTFYKNAVEMYNGDYFEPELKIGEVTAETSHNDRAIKYETRKPFDLMGIRVTASAAHGEYGFIAEVVTLPLSPGWRPDLGPGNRQRVMDTDMTNNLRGGVHFMNVGELNPSVQIERCRIQHCGYKILNITSPAIISMDIQNSRLLTISNNYMNNNYGGVYVNTTTNSLATAIYSNITNNVIMYNSHGSVLHIEGHHFQGVNIRQNYIAWNNVSYRNLMSMFGVHLNFTSNIVKSNVARTIINATVPKQVAINQRYAGNTIYDNEAIGGNKTTIFLKSAKFSFNGNFLLNRLNKFEMVTFNRTKYEGDVYPRVDATMNWWGYGTDVFVSGRVMERRDDDYLIGVRYEPFHETNDTILDGRCYPGWILHDKKCYRYMGGVAPYDVAEKQCKSARARIAWASEVDDRRYLGEVVATFQENYDQRWRVWVYSDWETKDTCSSLKNYDVDQVECNLLLSYVCERDPYVSPSMYWRPIIITLAVIGGVLLIVFILVCLAVLKARTRKAQHFERRDSLRASLRSSRQSVLTNRSALQTDDMRLQRTRRPPLRNHDYSGIDLSGVTLGASSTDSINMLKLDAHRPGTPGSTLDYLSTTPNETSSYLDSDLGPAGREYTPRSRLDSQPPPYRADYRQPPRLENEIANIMARPTFDNVLRNEAFRDDRSIDRLPMMVSDSPIAVGTPRRYVYPRPSLRSAGNSISSLDEKPKPKETAM